MSQKGVYPSRKKDGTEYFRASLTHRGRHISLGSFELEEAANRAYLQGRNILEDPDYTISHMESSHQESKGPLSFHKKVTLINFRDNGIYIANPIYLYRKFFEYYLSETRILKFDRDDLFYYSSHKIMERGGRLFVSDYGMQVGIGTRYGIKPYAVLGRDYCFVNGDVNDYRYENIRIDNTYNGVEAVTRSGKTTYKSRIHINGNTIIGNYATDTEAAVAYNKAIDVLKTRGINKNYTPNYVIGLSSEEYLKLYDSITLSDYFTEEEKI